MLDLLVALALGAVAQTIPDRKQRVAKAKLEYSRQFDIDQEKRQEASYYREIRYAVEKIAELKRGALCLYDMVVTCNQYNYKYCSGKGAIKKYRSNKILEQIGMTEDEFMVWVANLWTHRDNNPIVCKRKGDDTYYETSSYYTTIAGRKMMGGHIFIPMLNAKGWEYKSVLDMDFVCENTQKYNRNTLKHRILDIDPVEIMRKYPKDLMDIVTNGTAWRQYEDKCGILWNEFLKGESNEEGNQSEEITNEGKHECS